MGDELDDILSSALDEVEQDDKGRDNDGDLNAAVAKAADDSAKAADAAKDEAARAAQGFDEASAEDLLKQLDDPEFAKTLEETLQMLSASPDGAEGFGEGEEDVAKTIKALAEAAQGLEGADAAQAEEMGEKIMQEMMQQFEKLGGKEDFQSMMDGMMQQLLSKEVLYEPIKMVCEKFPAWLADNEASLPKEEYERYGKQYQCFQRVVQAYETEPDNSARLSELMQELQEHGQPPAEIVKDLAPGLNIGEDGIPGGLPQMQDGLNLPPGMGNEQCKQQ